MTDGKGTFVEVVARALGLEELRIVENGGSLTTASAARWDSGNDLVCAEPGVVAGWHHHGEHETTIYVVSGRMRLECGPGGETVLEAGPGDFLRVPAGAVHRESNPGDGPCHAVLVRCGDGTTTVNVEGPA